MLTISANNLGPIAEGTSNLKPLDIFIGPSNTGKSYMAMGIYSMMRALSPSIPLVNRRFAFHERGRYQRLHHRVPGYSLLEADDISDELVATVQDWASALPLERTSSPEITVSALPSLIRSEIENSTQLLLGRFQRDTLEQLHLNFGGLSGFLKRGAEPEDFLLTLESGEPSLNVAVKALDQGLSPPGFDVSRISLHSLAIDFKRELSGRLLQDPTAVDVAEFIFNLRAITTDHFLKTLPLHSFYLPAGRLGITQGYKVIGAAAIRQLPLAGVQRIEIPTVPSISAEFMSNLLTLERRLGIHLDEHGQLQQAVDFIEGSVLHGKIDLDESTGLPIPEIVYVPYGSTSEDDKFKLDQTSSMIQELAPLILYLKYLVRPGDLLVLEEPESHLHPAAQRRMAQGIVRLVNAGVKVVITTHSDMFVSQINNFLALGDASDELITKHGFESSDFLAQEQVSAYLFRHDSERGGSVIHSLDIDPDTGINEEEFSNVIESIYNESIALQRDRIL